MCAVQVAGFEVGAHVLALLMGGHLVAASDAVGAAFAGREFAYFGDFVGGDGDYYELCDVVAGGDVLGLIAGVVQAQLDGSAISAIHDAGAVAQYEVLLDTRRAAHKHHADMATGHGNTNAGVSYPVRANRHCEVVFQGKVDAGIVLVGLARVSSTIIERVIKQLGFLTYKKAPPVDCGGPELAGLVVE